MSVEPISTRHNETIANMEIAALEAERPPEGTTAAMFHRIKLLEQRLASSEAEKAVLNGKLKKSEVRIQEITHIATDNIRRANASDAEKSTLCGFFKICGRRRRGIEQQTRLDRASRRIEDAKKLHPDLTPHDLTDDFGFTPEQIEYHESQSERELRSDVERENRHGSVDDISDISDIAIEIEPENDSEESSTESIDVHAQSKAKKIWQDILEFAEML